MRFVGTRMSEKGPDQVAELVLPGNFVLATRDTGYRSPAYALAELVDNAIQAGASHIKIHVNSVDTTEHPIEVEVVDNGHGIREDDLQTALAFGGTSRFDDRSSLGRYGMGLPNGALALARRVSVCSWNGEAAYSTELDVDAIVERRCSGIPKPIRTDPPPSAAGLSSGTAVRLTACDRLSYRRVGNLVSRIRVDFARIYRRFLTKGLSLTVNGQHIEAFDPLFLKTNNEIGSGRPFGSTLNYDLIGDTGQTGRVTVRFSELPVETWSSLTTTEKRSIGIYASPSVSVMRAGREIDRGWFFMGKKRRENYDDWWRCEVSFDPELDALFGITHAKQEISPRNDLQALLTPDLEAVGRALNSRVRKRFEHMKYAASLTEAEKKALRAHHRLTPLPTSDVHTGAEPTGSLAQHFVGDTTSNAPYRIVVGSLDSTSAYDLISRDGQLIVVLNDRHPFFRDLYAPLVRLGTDGQSELASYLALTMLALARVEAEITDPTHQAQSTSSRRRWSDILASFFNA